MSELISHEQVLLDAVAAVNGDLPEGGFIVKSHGPNTDPDKPGDYSAVLQGVSGKVTGEVTVTYDRLDVATVLGYVDMNVIAVSGDQIELADVVQAIRDQLNINIKASDLPVQTYGPYEVPTQLEISVVPNSLLFRGTLPVLFVSGREHGGIQLMNSGRTTFITDPESPVVIQTIATTLTGNEVVANGNMIHSSGNPATNFANAATEEISISVAGRIWKSKNTIAAVDNNYFDITVPDNGDWNLPFSFALKNAPVGKKITDLYQINFYWARRGTSESIGWGLEEDETGKIIFKSYTEGVGNIVDNTVSADGRVVQNIQRMQHYSVNTANKVFSVTNVNTAGSILGEFTFTVLARRKDSLHDAVALNIIVNAHAPAVAPEA